MRVSCALVAYARECVCAFVCASVAGLRRVLEVFFGLCFRAHTINQNKLNFTIRYLQTIAQQTLRTTDSTADIFGSILAPPPSQTVRKCVIYVFVIGCVRCSVGQHNKRVAAGQPVLLFEHSCKRLSAIISSPIVWSAPNMRAFYYINPI